MIPHAQILTVYNGVLKVNNAGCMLNTREFVEGNIEVNFATNTLGTHILTKSLIPVISKGEKPRIVS